MAKPGIEGLSEEEARELAAGIVDEWREVGESEVWLSLPVEMSFDHLPQVIRSLAAAALAPEPDEALTLEVARHSARHGEDRHKEGFPENFLYTEYHLLRRSMWRLLKERLPPREAADVIMRVDGLIGLGTMACLRGFHRATYEERGDWPEALERVVDEWPGLDR